MLNNAFDVCKQALCSYQKPYASASLSFNETGIS